MGRRPESLRHRMYRFNVLDRLAVDGEGAFRVRVYLQDAAGEHEAEHRLEVEHHSGERLLLPLGGRAQASRLA